MTDGYMHEEPLYTKHWGSPTEPIKDTMREEPRIGQGTLFDFDAPAPKSPKVENHPTRSQKATKPIATPGKPTEAPKPYVPRPYTYAEHLKWFNGSHSLSQYWFNKQNIKE